MELVSTLREQLAKAEGQTERERQNHQVGRQTQLADRERLEGELRAAREAWEARLDGMAADLAEVRQTRLAEAEANARREAELRQLQAELERLRARPWWRRLFDAG